MSHPAQSSFSDAAVFAPVLLKQISFSCQAEPQYCSVSVNFGLNHLPHLLSSFLGSSIKYMHEEERHPFTDYRHSALKMNGQPALPGWCTCFINNMHVSTCRMHIIHSAKRLCKSDPELPLLMLTW